MRVPFKVSLRGALILAFLVACGSEAVSAGPARKQGNAAFSASYPAAAVAATAASQPAAASGAGAAAFSADAVGPYFAGGPAAAAMARLATESWQAARDGFAAHLGTLRARGDEGQRARLGYLIATCDARIGRWVEAASGFDRAATALPLLRDYARYHAARAYYFTHDLAKASDRATQVSAGSVPEAESRLLLGDIRRAEGRWTEVARTYEDYLEAFPRGMRLAEARFRLAEAYEHLGRGVPDALRLYRRNWIGSPLDSWGQQAGARMTALLEKVPPAERGRWRTLTAAERMERGMVYFDAMRNPQSEAELTAALAAPGLDADLECQVRYNRAQSVFKQRQRARSAPLFDEAVLACARTSNADLQMRAAYQAGRGYSYDDGPEADRKAIERFERAEKWHPEHSFADDARLRRAEIWDELDQAGTEGARDKVTELLSTLPELYPRGDMRAEALWRLAWRAYRAGAYADAISWLDKEIAAVPHDDNYWAEGQPLYWKGRAYEKLGKTEASLASYEGAVRQYPLGYYSLLALNRLRERDPGRFQKLVEEIRKPPQGWTQGKPELTFSPRPVYGEPGFARAVELLQLGLGSEAERELARLGLKVPGGRDKVADPDRAELLWATALLYHRAGRFSQSHWMTRWHIVDYRQAWPTEANRLQWEIAYPRAWWHLLERAAKEQGYPPELLIAFVREESAFDPILESFANAIGLTQMIFPTANRFGKGLGFAINRENLRDPEKNVAVGSRFLGFLHQLFDGHVGLMVPAYNAGEGAVWKWLCLRGDWPHDEFAEAIPYDETRLYSKRVLSSYFTYSWLRDGTVPVVENGIPEKVINRQRCAAVQAAEARGKADKGGKGDKGAQARPASRLKPGAKR